MNRLPSTKDAERKKAIVDYVLSTRRQILKLLVLVRWAKEAHKVQKCMVSLPLSRRPQRSSLAEHCRVSGGTEL